MPKIRLPTSESDGGVVVAAASTTRSHTVTVAALALRSSFPAGGADAVQLNHMIYRLKKFGKKLIFVTELLKEITHRTLKPSHSHRNCLFEKPLFFFWQDEKIFVN